MEANQVVQHAHGRGPITVVAAVIERADGCILIGQRRPGAWHEYKWEFPGGKVEPAESPRQAMRRELREELEIEAEAGREMDRYEYAYPGRPPISLIFYHVTQFSGEPRNMAFHDIRWVSRAELKDYDFLDGDIDFVRRLARPTEPERAKPA